MPITDPVQAVKDTFLLILSISPGRLRRSHVRMTFTSALLLKSWESAQAITIISGMQSSHTVRVYRSRSWKSLRERSSLEINLRKLARLLGLCVRQFKESVIGGGERVWKSAPDFKRET